MTAVKVARPTLQRLDAMGDVIAAVCLVYLIVFPVGHNLVLASVLLLLGMWCILRLIRRPRHFPPLLLVAAGCAGVAVLIGVVGGIGDPGFAHSLISWVAAPLLFWVWASQIDQRTLRLFLCAAAVATIVLAAIVLAFWGAGALGITSPGWIGALFDADISGVWPNVVVGVYGASSLIAVGPLWIVGMFFGGRQLPRRGLMIAAATLATLAAVVSTRRAALALTLAVPVLIFVVYVVMAGRAWFTRRHIRVVISTIGVAAAAVAGVLVTPAGQRMSAGVFALMTGRGGTADEDLRIEQVGRLWAGFVDSPVFGHGIGAVIPGYARSEDRPWAFEMQYHLILFQVGVAGALLLMASAVLVVWAAVRVATLRPDARPAIFTTGAGALAVIAANALNPLLQAPGHFWPVFLFIGAIAAFWPDSPIRQWSLGATAPGDDAPLRAD
ncbi:hypothetical protein [Microbacterium sp. NPDC091676]|uniref:hypothetical protein n=1 Tax=Microbacterium sp. NPDC091676 TaxID=3364212 RepID=UPI00381BA3A4